MKALPLTPDLQHLARRVIWVEEPDQALADPVRFLAYAMTYATHEDMQIIRNYLSTDDLQDALTQAPPGIFDSRSWASWYVVLDQLPVPPLPVRECVSR